MAERLTNDTSVYLRGAKDSPIDWYPWGDEAFEAASRLDRPILLDIGAAWCHWCHVMDHQTYEDEAVVEALARDFVCIKVDRDARPDIDVRYQQAISALAGQGGWPLTAFLDHDGRPFYGGTFFPPQDAHGRPGFASVLGELARIWKEERDKVDHTAQHVQEAIQRYHEPVGDASDATLHASCLDKVPSLLARDHDTRYGGFGDRPKFPHISAIGLALARHLATNDPQLASIARRTLDKMAAGGIHDHVEGGFHRYSVDAHWTVPHFEKMAYDNAGLLRVYAQAAVTFDDPRYAEVAEGIVAWTLRHSPEHTFLCSQDADISPTDDGDHFTWTKDELRAAIVQHINGAARREFEEDDVDRLHAFACTRFGVEEHGDMHHDPARNVLELELTLEDAAAAHELTIGEAQKSEAFLLEAFAATRAGRPKPFVDTTPYTDQCMMYASALLEAGALLEKPAWTERALAAIDHMTGPTWDDAHGWRHTSRSGDHAFDGHLDDQVWAGIALVDAYRFAGRADLLDLARRTAHRLLESWRDEGDVVFTDTTAAQREAGLGQPLGVAVRPWLDQGQVGGNSTAALFLLRLGRAVNDDTYLRAATSYLAAYADRAHKHGIFAASWYQAAHEWFDEPPVATVLGWVDEPDTRELLTLVRAQPRAGLMVHEAAPGKGQAFAPEAVQGVLDNEDLIKDGAVVLVCRGQTCDAPTRDMETLPLVLRSSTTALADI